MSRAFVREDIEIPERATRWRSPSGLPPGALNLMTAEGAQQLRTRLAELKRAAQDKTEIAELERTLDSATIVEPQAVPDVVVFGATVTVRGPTGELKSYRVVGVDEVPLEPGNVSWVSGLGKALLAAELGQRIRLGPEDDSLWTLVEIG